MTFDERLNDEPWLDHRLDTIVKETSHRYTRAPVKTQPSTTVYLYTFAAASAILVTSGYHAITLAQANQDYSSSIHSMVLSGALMLLTNYFREKYK